MGKVFTKYKNGEGSNIRCYQDYYRKPRWWFQLRYDTQIKKKTILHVLAQAGIQRKTKRVLELGFGSGVVIFSFDKTSELYGIEISKSAISCAQATAKKKGYTKYFFCEMHDGIIPFPANYFDIIIASHVLEHMDDDCQVLGEMHRVLKKGGAVIIIVPINEKYEDPNHVHHYSSESLISLVQKIGYNVLYAKENEYLFHIVEKFYLGGYKERWKIYGPLIAIAFNIPTAILPWWIIYMIEYLMKAVGFKPRQSTVLLQKIIIPK